MPTVLGVTRSKRHKRKGIEERFLVASKGKLFEGGKTGLDKYKRKIRFSEGHLVYSKFSP